MNIADPLLLEPGALIKATDHIIGVELESSGKDTVMFKDDLFMYVEVQPSKRGSSYFKFRVLGEEHISVVATIQEFQKWFSLVYSPKI